jgi:hypothetical protein
MQVTAAIRLRGVARLLAMLPVIPMAWITVITIRAYQQESNLWPILLIFACPAAALYIGLVLGLALAIKRERRLVSRIGNTSDPRWQ